MNSTTRCPVCSEDIRISGGRLNPHGTLDSGQCPGTASKVCPQCETATCSRRPGWPYCHGGKA